MARSRHRRAHYEPLEQDCKLHSVSCKEDSDAEDAQTRAPRTAGSLPSISDESVQEDVPGIEDCADEGLTSEQDIPKVHMGRQQDSVLDPWDDERFGFCRVLMPAPRAGGLVELHQERETGTLVAVKRVPFHKMRENPEAFRKHWPLETESFWKELEVARRFGQQGVNRVRGLCQFYGAFVNSAYGGLLVSEYLPDGDLFDLASSLGLPSPERERQAWSMMQSLLRTVHALHERGVAHCDISLENAMLRRAQTTEVVLIDFGMAVIGDVTRASGVRGKPSYQAPEMHTANFYDARMADYFASGVVAYALAVGGYPWSTTRPNMCMGFNFAWNNGIKALLEHRHCCVSKGARVSVASCLSDQYYSMILGLLEFNPQRRLRASLRFAHLASDEELEAS